jgi:phage protein D
MVAQASPAVEIYTGQDFYIPAFEVRLRGQLLPKDVVRDVLQVTYTDKDGDVDSFELTINNLWDLKTRTFQYSDERLFDPGATLNLSMGYLGKDPLRLMITGEITSLRPSFPASGPSTLVVGGLNMLHRLRPTQVTEVYERRTDSEIARQIAQRLNVKIETDTKAAAKEKAIPYLMQDNQYDILFLMERAQFNGYDLFVKEPVPGEPDDPVLHFGPSQGVKRVTYRLSYGRSLMEFQPTLTTANQVSEVTVRGWDPVHKKKVCYTATRKELATEGVGARGGQKQIEDSFKQRQEIMVRNAPLSDEEARRQAIQTLEQIAKDMVTATGSVVGLPDLRAGSVIHVDGVGDRFSGRYFVTGTTHTINDGGYTTRFSCRREELKEGGR